jgi:S-(hydroxymethyl)glutathione dehydrogenase/alcohol dehydrogenase
MSVGRGEAVGPALAITANRGRVVLTNVHPQGETSVTMSAWDLTLTEKQVVGSLFGSANPRVAIPKLMALYAEGRLKLDELITRRYKLDEVNVGYEDMREGRNLRGILELGD